MQKKLRQEKACSKGIDVSFARRGFRVISWFVFLGEKPSTKSHEESANSKSHSHEIRNKRLSHPENHLRAVRKKPCFGGPAPSVALASASTAVKNCEAILFAAPSI